MVLDAWDGCEEGSRTISGGGRLGSVSKRFFFRFFCLGSELEGRIVDFALRVNMSSISEEGVAMFLMAGPIWGTRGVGVDLTCLIHRRQTGSTANSQYNDSWTRAHHNDSSWPCCMFLSYSPVHLFTFHQSATTAATECSSQPRQPILSLWFQSGPCLSESWGQCDGHPFGVLQ